MEVINQITAEITSVSGVTLLNVDPGRATNRTVVTFIGEPEAVVEAAFLGVKKAQELIDMRHHKGEHPRIGATDVLPLVPVAGVTMQEAAALAHQLAERVGRELNIPVYCYEAAAKTPQRTNLALCRAGEYEGLAKKLSDPAWVPDYGPQVFSDSVARSGATVIGARDFLLAVNFNLNTTSTRRANSVAYDVREKGRPMREGNPITGKKITDASNNVIYTPGTLKGTKAIGWYIAEYGIAQVSMNITDMRATPLHIAFEEVSAKASSRGMRVTGVEVVGLLPLRVLLDAGRYFLKKQCRSVGISDKAIIDIAICSMGLNDLAPFKPQQRIIEYLIADKTPKLVDMSASGFAEETASESAAPGGGSVSAYIGSLGAALGAMVANLSAHKAGWDSQWAYFSDLAERSHSIMAELLHLVDEDTAAFNKIMEVFSMPKNTDENKRLRKEAMQIATLYATEVPLNTMKCAFGAFDIIEELAKKGNPNSVSDAGVGALAIRTAIMGAMLNVKINAAGLLDREVARTLVAEADTICTKACEKEQAILKQVLSIINKE